ncbi:MAG: hypothetical protein KGL42_16980 [Betaproteobacteria bacterium]|nr:hypothetical protein [Betaproteobacteria bacterium]
MKKPTPTAESRAIKAAIDASGMRQKDIAPLLGVEPSMVSQWATGVRPLPADKAPTFARVVNYAGDVGALSVAYREVYAAQGAGGAVHHAERTGDLRDIGLVLSRLENDVRALNLTIGVIVSTMVDHRPAEAAEVASAIHRLIPPKFRDKGLLGQLLEALDAVDRAR